MFNFNIKKSIVAPAVFSEKYFRKSGILLKLAAVLVLISAAALAYGFFIEPFSEEIFARIYGFIILFAVLTVLIYLQKLFYQERLLHPRSRAAISQALLSLDNKYNLADFLSVEAGKCLWQALKWARRKNFLPLNAGHLFYFLLESEEAAFIFLRAGLSRNEIRKNLLPFISKEQSKLELSGKNILYAPDFQEVILEGLKNAVARNRKNISVGDLIFASAKIEPYFKKLLIAFELKAADIANVVKLHDIFQARIEKKRKIWEADYLALLGSIGREFSAGYTINLDQCSENLCIAGMKDVVYEIIGHKKEVEELERILSRSRGSNVLLVGRPGSGRKHIIKYFAKRSFTGLSAPLLNYKRIMVLNLPSLLAQLQSLEQAEETLDRIFKEIQYSGSVILVIEDLHNYVLTEARPGVLNISGLLGSYLVHSEFQVIATTTYNGLHTALEQNPSLLSFFNKIDVREMNEEETLEVLEEWMPAFEMRYKKMITYPAAKEIILLSSRYLPDAAFPRKAIDLLDEVMVYAAEQSDHPLVIPEDVQKIVTEKTDIPVGKIEKNEKTILINMEKLIHDRVINQEEAVGQISEALRRARTEITIRKGPMGSFLFLGPTGVGKTETSKALAQVYFGSEKRMIRLDMSEFQSVADIARILGAAGEEGILTSQVRDRPFSLILLDEIEKAHPNILNLFLQVLDEGHLTDGLGQKVNFQNTIIIATSNAGASIIWESVRRDKKLDIIKEDLLAYIFQQGLFRPEFINRFDGVVIFKPLSRENLFDIANLMLSTLAQNLADKEIELSISPPVKEKVVDLSYNPAFGAREMRRVIQDKIENILAMALLKNEIKKGDKVKLIVNSSGEFQLMVNP